MHGLRIPDSPCVVQRQALPHVKQSHARYTPTGTGYFRATHGGGTSLYRFRYTFEREGAEIIGRKIIPQTLPGSLADDIASGNADSDRKGGCQGLQPRNLGNP